MFSPKPRNLPPMSLPVRCFRDMRAFPLAIPPPPRYARRMATNKTRTSDAAVRTIVRLITDRTHSAADLSELTGLGTAELAALLESAPVQTALADLRRIAAVRCDFLAAESDFIATATLLNVATAPQDSPRAADHARKAANNLRKSTPAKFSPVSNGGGGRRSLTEGEACNPPTKMRDPQPTPTTSAPNRGIPPEHLYPTQQTRAPANTPRKPTRPSPAQLCAATGADHPP